jgi:hypothetical protein
VFSALPGIRLRSFGSSVLVPLLAALLVTQVPPPSQPTDLILMKETSKRQTRRTNRHDHGDRNRYPRLTTAKREMSEVIMIVDLGIRRIMSFWVATVFAYDLCRKVANLFILLYLLSISKRRTLEHRFMILWLGEND